MTVTVKYVLSQAGQRAALLAGRPATTVVVETMEVPPSLVQKCTITSSGVLEYDAYEESWSQPPLRLDAPPVSLAALIAALEMHRAALAAASHAAQQAAERAAKAAVDAPVVERREGSDR